VARDGVGKACAHHHKFVLPLAFRSAGGAADGVVQAAQLAFGSGIHIAHAAYHYVRLIVEIERIGNQLLDVHFGSAVAAPVARAAATGTTAWTAPRVASGTSIVATLLVAATWAAAAIVAWRPIVAAPLLCLLLFRFSHCLFL
jgi:hypothetical protein